MDQGLGPGVAVRAVDLARERWALLPDRVDQGAMVLTSAWRGAPSAGCRIGPPGGWGTVRRRQPRPAGRCPGAPRPCGPRIPAPPVIPARWDSSRTAAGLPPSPAETG